VASFGGRQVHLVSTVAGQPTVLLLGGCGVPSYVWDDVAALLPDLSMLRLDRPGLMETPWPGRLPELAEEVATLAELVDAIAGPVVVVAHSMAGPHAEALVRQHPGAVSGLVLVDGSVEWELRKAGRGRGWLLAARGVRRAMAVRALRPLGPLADHAMVVAQSRRVRIFDPVSTLARATYRRGDTVASVIAEQAAYGSQIQDLAEVRKTASWPGTPTVVLTAAGDGGKSWVEDQRRLAELLGARQVVPEDSRHLMMIDRPDAIAEAVRSVAGLAGAAHD
jgi:pimeloyl-ACP methyl ester carboxylesterase